MRQIPMTVRLIVAACLVTSGAIQSASAQFVRPKPRKPAARTPKPAERKPPAKARQAKREQTPSSAHADSLESRIALQLALEKTGFSPGLIDGHIGPKTHVALAAFQAYHGIEPSGELDEKSRERLKLSSVDPMRNYTLTVADAARVGPCPTDWIERSQADRMPFKSLLEVAAFEGHCSHRLIAGLNPGIDVDALKVGQTIRIPNVLKSDRRPAIAELELDFENKHLRGLDSEGNVVALFHCSIARQRDDRPQGECRINAIAVNPQYTFRPESWPEVKGIDRALQIPPGPRNPVGMCWIDLSIDGYGIHGTPEPEMIGKTGSHGCIRLTNWDVLRLSEWVRPGMKVALIHGEHQVAAASSN